MGIGRDGLHLEGTGPREARIAESPNADAAPELSLKGIKGIAYR
jgi:hypothetical protein